MEAGISGQLIQVGNPKCQIFAPRNKNIPSFFKKPYGITTACTERAVLDLLQHYRNLIWIGVSGQILKMLKYDRIIGKCTESIGYREHCHTDGTLRVYIRSPRGIKSRLVRLFELVRYWGQRESLTSCVSVREQEPRISECAQLVDRIRNAKMRDYFACFLSDLKKGVSWKDIMEMNENSIELNLYVSPLCL